MVVDEADHFWRIEYELRKLILCYNLVIVEIQTVNDGLNVFLGGEKTISSEELKQRARVDVVWSYILLKFILDWGLYHRVILV